MASPITTETAPESSAPKRLSSMPERGNTQLPGYIRSLFLEARQNRAPLVAEWKRNYSLLHNSSSDLYSQVPNPEIPEIWPLAASQVGWMMDQRPTTIFAPISERSSEAVEQARILCEDLSFLAKAHWDGLDYDMANEAMLWDTATYGTGFLKTLWDPRKSGGLGDPVVRRVDPYSLLVDPAATSMEDANYFIEVRNVSLQEVDRRFPGAFEILARSAGRDDVDEAPNRIPSATSSSFNNPVTLPPDSTTPKKTYATQAPNMNRFLHHRGITVYEAWLREHVLVDGKVKDFWRCIIMAGNTILMDVRSNQLWKHAGHPYDHNVLLETGEFWGQSLVGLLASAQVELNRLLQAVSYNLWLSGNPVMVEPRGSGLPRTNITNRAGQRHTVNPGYKPDWMVPPQIQSQIPGQIISYFISRMGNTSGINELQNGQGLPGRNSTDTVNRVQESGFVRVRQALRGWERTLRGSGFKYASLIAQFYDEPRWVTFVGTDGEPQFRAFRARHFHAPTPDGYGPLSFGLIVDAGSSLPTSHQALASLAVTLYGLGAIDRQDLLTRLRWPDRYSTLARVNALEATGQFMPPNARQRAH